MNRQEYTTCMKPWMTGGGPDRKERFCIGAKVCSKGVSREEAAKLCSEAASNPKPQKVRKTRGKCKIDVPTLSACVIKAMEGSELTLANLTTSIAGCTGQKAEKALTQERFIKKCFKENSTAPLGQYDLKEAQKLRSFCIARWKEQEVTA